MLAPRITRRPARASLPRHRRRAWAAGALLGAAFAAAACGDATWPLPREDAPDALEFSIGGFGVGGSTVELRGDTVVLRRTPWGWTPGAAVDSVRAVPAPDSWRAFWAAAERAGVRRWRPQYTAGGVVDGTDWRVRIVAGGRMVESSGSNAYPDQFGHEHELEMTEEFRTFLGALGGLVGEPILRF